MIPTNETRVYVRHTGIFIEDGREMVTVVVEGLLHDTQEGTFIYVPAIKKTIALNIDEGGLYSA